MVGGICVSDVYCNYSLWATKFKNGVENVWRTFRSTNLASLRIGLFPFIPAVTTFPQIGNIVFMVLPFDESSVLSLFTSWLMSSLLP